MDKIKEFVKQYGYRGWELPITRLVNKLDAGQDSPEARELWFREIAPKLVEALREVSQNIES